MAGESKAGFGTSNVLAVIVTDRELCVGSFFVAVINDTDVTASENWTFVRVVSDCKLS